MALRSWRNEESILQESNKRETKGRTITEDGLGSRTIHKLAVGAQFTG